MRLVVWTLVLAGCERMTPTGDPLSPVRPAPAARPSPTSAPVPASDDGESFPFEEDEGTDGPVSDLPDDPAALLAMSQGKPIPPPAPARPIPAPVPVPVAPVDGAFVPSTPAVPQVWDPSAALPTDWGVHVVSTLLDTQPPMAVMGLPDGQTVVVKPGSFLADRQLVVMAIGRDVVQVAKVVPEGYRARIETRTLGALYAPSASVRLTPEP